MFQSIAKHKQPHTIAEKFVVPCCQEIVRIMIGETATKGIVKVLLSDNTASRRIGDTSVDILAQLQKKLLGNKVFAL